MNSLLPKPATCAQLRFVSCLIWARFILVIWLCGGRSSGAAPSEAISSEYHRPVPVELINWVDVHHLHAGSSFFVKVIKDWTGLGCFFRGGQIIEAKVELASLRGRRSSPSQLAVSFDNVPCVYNKSTLSLVVAAAVWERAENNVQFPIVRYSGGGRGGIQGSFVGGGIEMMALGGKQGKHNRLKPGDVFGIPGVTLRMGAGPGRSSILESSTRDVSLERESVFVLVPASVAFLHPSSLNSEFDASNEDSLASVPAEDHRADTATAAAVLRPPREFLACEPPACNVDLPTAGREHLGKALESIALHPFGYAPRPQREIEELNNDDALVWLGSHQLMVAFNPHTLIPREGATSAGATVRRIHAVVLDLTRQKVVSTADWDLPDREAYIWQLSNSRVLVHVGNELRVLSEGLKVENRISLEGPLAFVRTSPNGELMAVAVIHERHSPELHSRLREALGHEPDEDVQIRILDGNFQTVAQATSSREIMPPILLNEGQVQLLASSGSKYRLEMLPWQGGSFSVARFSSACLPSVSSFAPDLLFVTSCALETHVHEYRVLRPNGAVVMHGKSDPQIIGQGVLGTDGKFAVKVLHARRAVVDGSVFCGEDLDFAEVRIYRSEDGSRVSAFHTAMPPPSRGAFALSTDGSQLAILSDSQVSLFSLP